MPSVILGAARTPFTRVGGGLAAVSAVELGQVAARAALERAGVAPRADEVVHGDFSPESGAAAMRRLLKSTQPPSAVFVCNDMMAIGALHAAHEAGIDVPRQLSVVGFDDIELAAYTSPPLTTVAQPKEAIGTGAAGLLLERLREGRSVPRRAILPAELHRRASTARPQA